MELINLEQFKKNISKRFDNVEFDIDFSRISFFACRNNNIFKLLSEKEQEQVDTLSFREKKELKDKLSKIYWALEEEIRLEFRREFVKSGKKDNNLFFLDVDKIKEVK